MQSKQYTIGAFAAINKISTRMLRHYDKIGLLKPVTILPNGYRAYNSEQITSVSQIKQYQSCGFTLAEIGILLHADEEQIIKFVKEKQIRIRLQDTGNNNTYRRLCGLLGEEPPAIENRYTISFVMQEEKTLFLGENTVSESCIEWSFDRLYSVLDSIGATPAGLPHLLSEGMGDGLYRTAVPVKQELFHNGFISRVIPSGWYLSTIHFGDYDSIGAAYDSLLCCADEENRCIAFPIIERYFLDRIHTANPNEFITEVSVKIIS